MLDDPELETEFKVHFPQRDDNGIAQDLEYCILEIDGEQERVRFHDYDRIYRVPGLYEHLFYDVLECQSPRLIATLIEHEVSRTGGKMADLRVLDVGAGNGMMGEVLAEAGVGELVGVDILIEAEEAAQRDRPGLYREYFSVDLLQPPQQVDDALAGAGFNCLTVIAALGFGDIPCDVFTQAFNYVEPGGLLAFNLNEDFLADKDRSGFAALIRRLETEGRMEAQMRIQYVHRKSITGEPLLYSAFIGRKLHDIPAA